jgi:hypothetical protein
MPKINLTDTYQTRDGRKVRVLAVDLKSTQPNVRSVVAAITDGDRGYEYIAILTEDGKLYGNMSDLEDLIPVPKPFSFERFCNVYRTKCGATYPGSLYDTAGEAKDDCAPDAIASGVRVTISGVEGQGL